MSIDARGRAATADLRRATVEDLDVAAMRHDLVHAHRAQTRTRMVAAAAAVVLMAGGGALVASRLPGTAHSEPAAPAPTVTNACFFPGALVECLDEFTYRVGLPVPVTITRPTTFSNDVAPITPAEAEMYRNDVENTGVTVLEHAIAAQNTLAGVADPAGGTDARSYALWLASRPFVKTTTPRTTTIDGRTAYVVDATLRPGGHLGGSFNGAPAGPTFWPGDMNYFAVSQDLRFARYYLVDVPGAGVTVIWSWVYDGPAKNLAGNEALIRSLHFG